MTRRWVFAVVIWLLGLALGTGLGTAIGQQAPPTETKGLKATVIAALDLGPEIDGMQGRQLRMRMLTLEPGGVIAMHNHKDRPTAVYLLQGTVRLYEGGSIKEYYEGNSWAEGKAAEHWAENRGTKPSVAIVVDIFKQP